MDEVLIIAALGAFVAAALTVPAGFGLSTILTPFVLLLMGPHEAVAVVAVVHGGHNAAKCWSMWDSVDLNAFRHYGVWLVFGSILGAILQNQVPQNPLLIIIGIFLIILPILSLSERWTGYTIPEANDRIGGLVAAMPLTTFLILFWMNYENVSENKISAHVNYTLLYLIATIPMFIVFSYCLNKFGFWITIFISIFITLISALIVHQISKNFDIKLF